jgi:predicted esterase
VKLPNFVLLILLEASLLTGCDSSFSMPHLLLSTPTPSPTPTNFEPTYSFPEQIDPGQSYLFYLHGKIIEDQGIPAISPDFGEYQYFEILERLSGYGFVVISEQRSQNTDSLEYANKIASQVKELLAAGVPAKNITLVGASQGAGIVIYVSHLLENEAIYYVILAICHPDTVWAFKQAQIHLYGNVLSIYDSSDDLAGSCQALFEFSEGKGLARVEEVVLTVDTGHGILYQPLDEWVLPTIHWAGK